jgi:hypothetical protein
MQRLGIRSSTTPPTPRKLPCMVARSCSEPHRAREPLEGASPHQFIRMSSMAAGGSAAAPVETPGDGANRSARQARRRRAPALRGRGRRRVPLARVCLGRLAEHNGEGARDRGDAVSLPARSKPLQGTRVGGRAPSTEDPLVGFHVGAAGNPANPRSGSELQHARTPAPEQAVEVVRDHVGGSASGGVASVDPARPRSGRSISWRPGDGHVGGGAREPQGREARSRRSRPAGIVPVAPRRPRRRGEGERVLQVFIMSIAQRSGRDEPRGRVGDDNGVGEWR